MEDLGQMRSESEADMCYVYGTRTIFGVQSIAVCTQQAAQKGDRTSLLKACFVADPAVSPF